MALQVSDIVRIQDRISARSTLRREIGRTLLLTRDSELDAAGSGKVKAFSSVDEVVDFYGSTSVAEGLKGARVYFAQTPYPRDLLIGRQAGSPVNSEIRGGAPGARTLISGIAAGSFRVGGQDFSGLDLTSTTDYASIAAALQAELRGGSGDVFTNSTVTYQAAENRFVVALPSRANVGVFQPHSSEAGADISGILGLDSFSGATFHLGSATETITQALDAIAQQDDSFYFVTGIPAMMDGQDAEDMSDWCQTRRNVFMGAAYVEAVLTTGESATEAAMLSATEPERSNLTYHKVLNYAGLAAAGMMSGINFSASGSLLTMKFRKLAGIDPVDITSAQKAELDRKRINVYAKYGNQSFYSEGYNLKPGVWTDVRVFLDWLVETTENAILSHLQGSLRIPRTRAGIAGLHNVIAGVCQQGVRNGGLAPGKVSEAMAADIRRTTGRPEFDGNLSTGFLIYNEPLSGQTADQIAAREAPDFHVWLKGSSAVHFCDLSITYGE